ncbi:type II toxin-antitoxin system VapC family toxin [Spirulina major CS-329]|uniref:type II toxin-antitoxin system tRNA(fMet)-specific endonuclease VapC n=1 Tax=Spirulina TaxID=1154 RepID=UPI00232A8736|nr:MULTISPECIES: type II toxin-antitoxin system VapC family toxin [Spirulina]MDB9495150.1 type II toxin-antitoxin system VapC family toxin [Spirulina subsalsa CS-330]MDB9502176.1 type II toxin-antitoxin system VapC family toxin [Spirulina major CS-329]
MKYLLDTNICIYLIKQKPKTVFAHLEACSIEDIGISSISVAELQYGITKSQKKAQNQSALEQFLIPLEILEFDQKAATIYGNLRTDLELRGQVIGAMDMLIAAHAISLDLILVTNNTREFNRVDTLKVEDWTT